MDFGTWITEKYLLWRGARIGRGSSVADFSKEIGISHQLMSEWMKKGGKQPRSAKYINALVAKYGDEAYRVLGLAMPSNSSSSPLSALPAELRGEMEIALTEINEIFAARGIPSDSPEAVEIALSVLEKHGFAVISKRK